MPLFVSYQTGMPDLGAQGGGGGLPCEHIMCVNCNFFPPESLLNGRMITVQIFSLMVFSNFVFDLCVRRHLFSMRARETER